MSGVTSRVRLPTRRRDWRLLARTVRLVLGIPTYAGVALAGALAGLTTFVASQNPDLVWFALTGPGTLGNRVDIVVGLYPYLGTSYGAYSDPLLYVLAALIGVDVAMLAYHVREHGLEAEESATGTVGVALGVLGAGCGACGTVLLTGLLSLFGATGVLTLLPLEGLELTLVALVVLVLSVYWLAEGLRGGEIRGCPVDL
jgi:hypothetical protein